LGSCLGGLYYFVDVPARNAYGGIHLLVEISHDLVELGLPAFPVQRFELLPLENLDVGRQAHDGHLRSRKCKHLSCAQCFAGETYEDSSVSLSRNNSHLGGSVGGVLLHCFRAYGDYPCLL